jgi:tetratricopeptide (TPR) repeat protein
MMTERDLSSLMLLLGLSCATMAIQSCESIDTTHDLNPVSLAPNVELLALGDDLFKQSRYAEAKQAYARAVNANGPNYAYVEACSQVARMESIAANLNEGRPWLELAVNRASDKEPLGWSRLQLVLGIFEREAGDRAGALQRFKELYDYDLQHELYERAIDVAHHIVLASEDSEEQKEWTFKGIEAAEEGGMQSWLAVLWNNYAASLESQGRWEDAYLAYDRARDYHYEVGSPTRMLIADWALARAERMTGRIEKARSRSTEAYQESLQRYAADPTPSNAEWVGYLRWELAELDALDGQTEKALAGLEEARASLIEARIETWGNFGTAELARLDARLDEMGTQAH